jgi:hypothetical protein
MIGGWENRRQTVELEGPRVENWEKGPREISAARILSYLQLTWVLPSQGLEAAIEQVASLEKSRLDFSRGHSTPNSAVHVNMLAHRLRSAFGLRLK